MISQLTSEQRTAVEAVADGNDLKVVAYAGAGKTHTLKAMTNQALREKNGLYLAFNKSIEIGRAHV